MDDIGAQPEAQMTPPSSGAPELVGQWSWAGFMFNGLYLIAHNHVGLGVGLLVAMIVLLWVLLRVPLVLGFLVFLVSLGIMIFVAIKGHEYAWSGGVYNDGEQFSVSHRVLNTMGKVMFFIWLVVVASFVMPIIWLVVVEGFVFYPIL